MTPKEAVSAWAPIQNLNVDVVVDGILIGNQEAFHRPHATDSVKTGRLAPGLERLAM